MTWNIVYLDEAKKDLKRLDHAVQVQVLKGIQKVARNPVAAEQGGYGKPLGNKNGSDLTNLLKIKFLNLGIRVVYKVEITATAMTVIVVSARADEQMHKEAAKRRTKYGI